MYICIVIIKRSLYFASIYYFQFQRCQKTKFLIKKKKQTKKHSILLITKQNKTKKY